MIKLCLVDKSYYRKYLFKLSENQVVIIFIKIFNLLSY